LVAKLPKFEAILVLAVLLGGCASATHDGVYDPFEPVNREIFDFNHSLDKHAALPAASYYKHALPDTVRTGVHNFMSNLTLPVSMANDLLQGEVTYAGYAICRLGVNSTIGILGFTDPATDLGCIGRDEDFGQTLGVWGVPGGPYFVLPLMGSTTARDIGGKLLIDHYFNPFSYVRYSGKYYVGLGQTAIKAVDQRSRAVSALHEVERTSIDYYAAMRRLYALRRDAAITNEPRPGARPPEAPGESPVLDDDDNPTPGDKPTAAPPPPAPAPLAPDAPRQ
jgi:phospholipid-binding lipoprotein MlaA